MASVLQKLLASGVLSLQLEDKLLVIPTRNIRSAQISPAPDKLQDIVLRNVQRVAQSP